MEKISIADLAKECKISHNVLRTYLGHFTLTKHVTTGKHPTGRGQFMVIMSKEFMQDFFEYLSHRKGSLYAKKTIKRIEKYRKDNET